MNLLQDRGRTTYLIGVNYWARHAGPLMWRKWDPAAVEAELRQMKALGMNVCRSFLYTPDFMPNAGSFDPEMLRRFDEFLSLCERNQVQTIPTFFVGHMSGENWDVGWRGGRNFYSDPWMLEQESYLVRTIAERYHDHPAIAGWLLSNEIPLYAQTTDRASGTLWVQTLMNAIRSAGAKQPISPGDGGWSILGIDNGLRQDDLAPLVDFFGPHSYPMDIDALRHSYTGSWLIRMNAVYGKPVVMEEFGCSTMHASEQHQADYYRIMLHSTFINGAAGCLGWCNSDFDLPSQRPYAHHPFEMNFGVTRADGSEKPAAHEIRRFSDIVEKIDLESAEVEAPQAAIISSSYYTWDYPFFERNKDSMRMELQERFVLAKEAHLPVAFWQEPKVPFNTPAHIDDVPRPQLPDPTQVRLLIGETMLTAPTWEALVDWIAAGGTLFCSYARSWTGMWIHNFEQVFGCRNKLRFGVFDIPKDERAVMHFAQDFGNLKAGEQLEYSVSGLPPVSQGFCLVEPVNAEVIARDGQGNPVLVSNTIGSGRAIFCAYPLEHYLIGRPEIHLSDSTWRLYKALGEVAGIQTEFECDNPFVEIASVTVSDARLLWLINHSWDSQQVRVQGMGLGKGTDFETGELLGMNGGAFQIEMTPREVIVIHIEEIDNPGERLMTNG